MEISDELKSKLTIDQKEVALLTTPPGRAPSVLVTALVAVAQAAIAGWLLYVDHDRNGTLSIVLFMIAGFTAREHHLRREQHKLYTLAREIIEHHRSQKQPQP